MNKKLVAVFSGMMAIVLLMGYSRVTAIANPGDASDPLVTKRYVDEQIAAVRAAIQGGQPTGASTFAETPSSFNKDALFAEVLAYINAVYGSNLDPTVSIAPSAPAPAAQAAYEAVFVLEGKRIVGQSGTELILRGGSAIAVSGENGLVNITSGIDVVNGEFVQMNHMHIVPGDDGRGMRFLTDSYLMVKGVYYIVD